MQEFLAWLRERHIADVVKAGAQSGYVVAIDGELTLEGRYRFASREAFEKYVREGAPRLREEGLKVAERVGGVTFARTSGEIVFEIS